MTLSLRKILLILAPLLILGASTCLGADDISLDLRIDRNKASITDSVRMIVKLSGVRSAKARPEITGLKQFDVNQGGTSSRVEIVNGKMSAGIEYSYVLYPKETGSFTIGPAKIKINGKVITSNKVNLTIIEPQKMSGESRGPLFLSAELSSDEIYLGDQVVYTLRLFYRVRVSDPSLQLPEAEHFTFKQLGKPAEYQSMYNNESYQVLEVRYSLAPSEEGTFGIRPARMTLVLQQANRRSSPFDLFDDPFFSGVTGERRTVASEPLEINVLPIPEQGRPKDFSGLVGNYEIESKLEPSQVKAGESATLTVSIRGKGNVQQIPDLKMPEPAGLKVYADQPVLEEGFDENGQTGLKTFKYALVPEKEGEYSIPSLGISFFDTSKKQYRAIKTNPYVLKAIPGEEQRLEADNYQGGSETPKTSRKKEIEELGHDILPVHTSLKDFGKKNSLKENGPLYWLLLLGPVILYAATFAGLKIAKRSNSNEIATRSKKAARLFINQSCKSGVTSRELISAFQEYLNNRLGLSLGTLTPSDAFDILKANNVSDETAQAISSLIRRFEDAVYTGKGDDPCEVQDEIRALIRKIEKELR